MHPLYGLLVYVWLLIGWFSNPTRGWKETLAGIALLHTCVSHFWWLPKSINQSSKQPSNQATYSLPTQPQWPIHPPTPVPV